jgi:uncharacterized protein
MHPLIPSAPVPCPSRPRGSRPRRLYLCGVLAAALLSPLAACDRGEPAAEPAIVTTTPNGSRLELPAGVPPVEFPAGTARIEHDGQVHTLRIEIAETDVQRERGLMFRTAMPEESGMVFIYPQEIQGGFWMANTRIPLDIAYMDSTATVFQILQMDPCVSEYVSLCPTYPARRSFQFGLEVNQGYFARHGIGPGARVTWERE